MRDVSVRNAVERMARGDMGTLIIGRRAVVFMPRWFYISALVACFGIGLLIGVAR